MGDRDRERGDRPRDDHDGRRDDRERRPRSSSRERGRAAPAPARQRKYFCRRPTGWDVKPTGGPVDGMQAMPSSAEAPVAGAPTQQTRHARRLYVGGLGESTEREIGEFFSDLVRSAAVAPPKANPILSVYINAERKFAFVEFNSIELANAIMQLDGLLYKGQPLKIRRPNDYAPTTLPADVRDTVEPLNIGHIPLAPQPTGGQMASGGGGGGGFGGGGQPSMGGGGAPGTRDSLHRIFLGGLPAALGEAQLTELLGAFGRVRTLNVVRGPDGAHKGYGFAEFEDPSVTDTAIGALNGLAIGDRAITVSRAKPAGSGAGGGMGGPPMRGGPGGGLGGGMGPGGMGMSSSMPPPPGGNWSGSNNIPLGAPRAPQPGQYGAIDIASAAAAAAAMQQQQQFAPPASSMPAGVPSSAVCLEYMVTAEDLASDGDYRDICDDISAECSKYGALTSVVIPRPPNPAAGRVFLAYSDIGGGIAAATSLAGRVFGGRPIAARYYDAGAFAAGVLTA